MEEYVWISKLMNHSMFVNHSHSVLKHFASDQGVRLTLAGSEDTQDKPYLDAIKAAIRRRVAGLMIVGWPGPGVTETIDEASETGIPVVTVDSDIPNSNRLAFVGTDWFAMGADMADTLADQIGRRGKVLLLSITSLANAATGVSGFHQRIQNYPDIEVVGNADDFGVDEQRARDRVAACLAQHPDLAGVAGFDANSGPGAAAALADAGRDGEVKLVCVDVSETHLNLLRSGRIDAAYFQKREAFSYMAFQTLYTYNHGSPATNYHAGPVNITGNVETGHIRVTRENVDTFDSDLDIECAYERHQLSQRLAMISSVIENSPGITLAVDTDGRIVYVNPSGLRRCAYAEKEIVQLPFDALFQLTPQQMERAERCIREGTACSFEAIACPFLGEAFPVQMSLSPIRSGRTIRGAVIVAVDITERRRQEQERRRLDRGIQHTQKLESLGVLAGGIAHDFNNLLVAVMGNADLALADLPITHAAYDSVREIKKASLRASELTNQLLAYSGRGHFVIEKTDLNHIVGEMAHLLEISISKKAVLQLELAEELAPVEVDVAQMRQIVMNLITNASEALADSTGVITIRTGEMVANADYLRETHLADDLPPGHYVYLEVQDTGCGMDENSIRRLFDPFFTTKFAGRGLGLAAALGIIRGHRGAIKVKSEPGQGSTFRFLLPTAAEESPAAEDAAKRTGEGAKAGEGTIMVVDDEESVRNVSCAMLEAKGFSVVCASDGVEAVDLFTRNADRTDLVLLDLTMPRMDGVETIAELKRIRPDVRVILCSGYTESDAKPRLADQTVTGFLQKPFELTALLQAVNNALAVNA